MDLEKMPALCVVLSGGDTVIYLEKSETEWVEPCTVLISSSRENSTGVGFTPLHIFGLSRVTPPLNPTQILSGPYVPENEIEMVFKKFLRKYFEDIDIQIN